MSVDSGSVEQLRGATGPAGAATEALEEIKVAITVDDGLAAANGDDAARAGRLDHAYGEHA